MTSSHKKMRLIPLYLCLAACCVPATGGTVAEELVEIRELVELTHTIFGKHSDEFDRKTGGLIGDVIGQIRNDTMSASKISKVSLGFQFLSLSILIIYIITASSCKCAEVIRKKQEEQLEEVSEKVSEKVEMKLLEKQKLIRKKQRAEAGGSIV